MSWSLALPSPPVEAKAAVVLIVNVSKCLGRCRGSKACAG